MYITTVCLFGCGKIGALILGINKSLTVGTGRQNIIILGIHKWELDIYIGIRKLGTTPASFISGNTQFESSLQCNVEDVQYCITK
jgi:hypothetical protein